MVAENADGNLVSVFFDRSSAALRQAAGDRGFLNAVGDVARAIETSLHAGGKVLLAGNGGSAADAQHLAAEFLSRFAADRAPLPAIALTADTSVLTAIGNDYGFEHTFERQVRGVGRPGDVFIAISTSGKSANVLLALKAAREQGLVTVGFTGGRVTPMRELCQFLLAAPSHETAIIQQIYMVAGHAICALVERGLRT
jgi:D-sedoheptulose 7-phosphate isomerase